MMLSTRLSSQTLKTWMAGTSVTTGPAFGRTRLPGHDTKSRLWRYGSLP